MHCILLQVILLFGSSLWNTRFISLMITETDIALIVDTLFYVFRVTTCV